MKCFTGFMEILLKIGLLASIVVYLWTSPYTKVEESFNIQAIHDILNYGVFSADKIYNYYDHMKFPGVVPRTFVGSILVSAVATPIIETAKLVFGIDLVSSSDDQANLQLLVRLIIGLANGLLLMKLGDAMTAIDFQARKGKKKSIISCCYLFLLVSQFHILYYSSRTLPNFMALPFVNYALSKLLLGDVTGLTLLAFTGVVFRMEVGVFGALIAVVSSIVFRQYDLITNILLLCSGVIIGGLLSCVVDSYFWGELVIPEIRALQFNVFEGKASEWGVLPFETYFVTSLPQLFNPPTSLLLAALGLMSDPSYDGTAAVKDPKSNKEVVSRPSRNSLRILAIACIAYILMMSFQPHKEWRFIIYAVPVITLSAGNGFANMITKSKGSILRKLLVLLFVCLTFIAGILSAFLGYVSRYNYPGGEALTIVNSLVPKDTTEKTTIHLDVATCMTGATRFGQIHNDLVVYDKSETLDELKEIWSDIDYLVTEALIDSDLAEVWEEKAVVSDFGGISILPLIIFAQRTPTFKLFLIYLKELLVYTVQTRDFTELKLHLDLPLIRNDYLHIYKRMGSGDKIFVFKSIEELKQEADAEKIKDQVKESEVKEDIKEQVDEKADKVQEQVDKLEEKKQEVKEEVEVDIGQIVDQVNEEINSFEEKVIN